jgi:putative ABC transport system substrate-binding protein
MRDTGDVERAVTTFARSADSGLIVTGTALATVHRKLIITLAARHKLPAVYASRLFRGSAAAPSNSGRRAMFTAIRRASSRVSRFIACRRPFSSSK